ncbi:MAG: YtxH domain-containing protein [bacterium]
MALGITAGGLLGYGYYALIGCRSGGCAITGNPWISTAFGAVFGFLMIGPKE